MRGYSAKLFLWIVIYLFAILGPMFALILGAWPQSRGFWIEFSVALGYAGLAMLGLQFGLTVRFRHITSPWGDDLIYHVHRQLSLVAVLLVVAHPVILFVVEPQFLALLNSWTAPWRARFAALSTYSLLAIVVMSIWRKKLRLSYEAWHQSHMLLAMIVVVAGAVHMLGWGYYLASSWKRGLWIGMATFWIGLLAYIRIVKPFFILRRPFLVKAVRAERGDTYTLVMLPDGHAGLRFSPGQFAWLTVWESPFRPYGHPFVIASSAAVTDGRIEMAIRSQGDFTKTISSIPVGKRVYLDGPYGTFTLSDSVGVHVLIAGGVGIAPMMSIIRTLEDRGEQRSILLFYCSKNWDSITYREELEMIRARESLTLVHVLSDPPIDWNGESGVITKALFLRHLPLDYTAHKYFICGSDELMDAAEAILDELGVPMSQYRSEPPSFI